MSRNLDKQTLLFKLQTFKQKSIQDRGQVLCPKSSFDSPYFKMPYNHWLFKTERNREYSLIDIDKN